MREREPESEMRDERERSGETEKRDMGRKYTIFLELKKKVKVNKY
jgi:hypothetical protein